MVLFVAHSFQVQHLDHFVGDQLLLVVEVVIDLRGSFGDDGDRVGVEATVEPAFEDLAVFDWVLFEDFVDVFGGGLDAEALKVLGGVLLFEDFEEGRVFEVDFLSKVKGTSMLLPILMWKTLVLGLRSYLLLLGMNVNGPLC
jgi:hypothetical protein